MALSGTITKNVNSYWRLRLYWTASQDEVNNKSTITSRLYWESTSSNGSVYSSATKSGYNKIHTSQSNFTATAGLSGLDSKLLDTHTYTITHNSNGDASCGLYGSFDVEVSLSGTYYGTVSLSGTASLDRIARASTLSVTPSWTAGSNDTISISRASSSFKHEAIIYVKDSAGNFGASIKTVDFSTSQTSLSTSFSVADNKAMFLKLAGRASTDTRIILKTYSGNTFIGQTERDGTLTAPAASVPKSGYDAYQYVDELIDVPITRAHHNFLHTVRFKLGTFTKTLYDIGPEIEWTPNSTDQDSLYAQMPNVSFMDGTIEIDTLYEDVKVRGTESRPFQFHVRNSNPIFTGIPTYSDINTAVTAVTGNNQYIVQGKSKVRVSLTTANRATAVNGATMKSYSATLAGKTVPATWSSTATVNFDFNEITASTNQTLVINAIDSRGKSSSVTKTILVVPYTPPTLTASAARINGFEASTTLKLTAKLSTLAVGSPAVNKNAKVLARYRVKESKATVWPAYVDLTTAGFPTVTATDIVLQLDNLKSYMVEFEVTDKLGGTTTLKTVSTGQPLFFLDDMLSSIGFGDFPKFENEIMINKRVRFGSNMYAGNSNAGESVGGALEMANSDITGLNGLYFTDLMSNSGEGLLFPRTSTPIGSVVAADYDNLYIRDGVIYMNNTKGLVMPSLHINSTGDVSSSSTGTGLTIGASETSGVRMKLDINEIQAFSGTSPSTLYINPDGGLAYVGFNSSTTTPALETNGAITINGNGNNVLNVYGTDHGYFQFYVKGSTTARSGYIGYGAGSSPDMSIANNLGEVKLQSIGSGNLTIAGSGSIGRVESMSVYGQTTSSAANVYVWSTGLIARSTSASKYKLDIQTVENLELSDRLLYLQPKSWYDKAASEALAEHMTRDFNGEDHGEEKAPFLKRHYGLIAEDLVDLGLDMFIQYGEPDEFGNREVEGIEYDRAWTLLIPTVRSQRDKILSLEERIEKLEGGS